MSYREAYKVIDVFAGPGGLGEGFGAFGFDRGQSPFRLTLSIEKDPSAHSTLMLRSFYRQFHSHHIPHEYWSYAKGEITKSELFSLYPRQAKSASEEAQCIELGKTPHQYVKTLINHRLGSSEKWVLVDLPEWQMAALLAEIRNAIAHTNGFIDYLPKDKRSLYSRLEGKDIELKTEIADQEDAQIILTRAFILDAIKVYRVLLSEIGELGRNFVTPKHGIPDASRW